MPERRALALASMLAACAAADGAEPDAHPIVVVERGSIATGLWITGEIDAASSESLSGPTTEDWQLAIRWLAEDGAVVHEGDRVVGFDNVAVANRIRELELAVVEAGSAILEHDAKTDVERFDKAFAAAKSDTEFEKAEVDGTTPAELLSRREFEKYALAVARTRAATVDAANELRVTSKAGALEAEVKLLALSKAERKLEAARAQLESLELHASRDGIVLVGRHPWEGRKLQVGDNVWPGMEVVRLPDLSQLVVKARLDDVDDGRVMPGMTARCTVDAYPSTLMIGHVVSVSEVAQTVARDSTRRHFDVVITLEPVAAVSELRPGLSVRAEIIGPTHDDVVVVPRGALDAATWPVTAQRDDGSVVELQLGACDAQRCEVLEGVRAGDRLRVTEGSR